MNTQKGFTIIELLIGMSISVILLSIMLVISLNFTGDMLRAQMTANMAIESQQLLRSIVDDTRLADALTSTNTISDANSPPGGWTTSDPSNVLIIESPAIDSARNIIYDTATGLPYRNEIIYYGSGSSMYRRTLKNTSAAGNMMTTTCPAPSASPSCSKDRLYTTNLKDLTFTFYDDDGNTTANAALSRSVNLTVTTNKKIYGREITFTNSIRTTMRNR